MGKFFLNIKAGEKYGLRDLTVLESVSIPIAEVHDFAGHPDDMRHIFFDPQKSYSVKCFGDEDEYFFFDGEMYVDAKSISESPLYPVVEGEDKFFDKVCAIYYGDDNPEVCLGISPEDCVMMLKDFIEQEKGDGNEIDLALCKIVSVPMGAGADEDDEPELDWDNETVLYCAENDSDYSL